MTMNCAVWSYIYCFPAYTYDYETSPWPLKYQRAASKIYPKQPSVIMEPCNPLPKRLLVACKSYIQRGSMIMESPYNVKNAFMGTSKSSPKKIP